jgi:hypothetical protein
MGVFKNATVMVNVDKVEVLGNFDVYMWGVGP